MKRVLAVAAFISGLEGIIFLMSYLFSDRFIKYGEGFWWLVRLLHYITWGFFIGIGLMTWGLVRLITKK